MLRRVFLGIIILIFTLPVLWVGLISLGLEHDNTTRPPTWEFQISLENYIQIKSEQTFFWHEFATSILLSAATTLLTVTVAFLAAYSLAHSTFRLKPLVVNSFLILASLPVISYVMPLNIVLMGLHLHDTFLGVMLAQSGTFAPLAVFILYGYVSRMPAEVEESALLDGVNLVGMLWRMVLPITAPGVIATAVIIGVLSWNQFFLPLVLTSTHLKTIPVMMRDFFVLDRDFEWPKVAAVIMISLLPVGVFVGLVHRSLEWFKLGVVTYDET